MLLKADFGKKARDGAVGGNCNGYFGEWGIFTNMSTRALNCFRVLWSCRRIQLSSGWLMRKWRKSRKMGWIQPLQADGWTTRGKFETQSFSYFFVFLLTKWSIDIFFFCLFCFQVTRISRILMMACFVFSKNL